MIFDEMSLGNFEQLIYCHDSSVGLKAIIAIHSTILGPAVGGCRMWNYPTEQEALKDVLQLAKGMTYKAALAGLELGGGKSVIIGDAHTQKTPDMLARFGEFVNHLKGHYVTAKDVGIGGEDLKFIRKKTSYVLGAKGIPNSSGDPSPATAFGVYQGMRACARFVWGTEKLKGLTIAVQGLGSVGYGLLKYLEMEGANLIGCDIDSNAIIQAKKISKISIVPPEEIYDVDCDIFSPCALGGSINSETIPRIRAKVIAGGANNQLKDAHQGKALMEEGIIYAPDYVINSGGLINIFHEFRGKGYQKNLVFEHISQIAPILTQILHCAQLENMPTSLIANRMAEERILKLRN